MHEIFVSYRRIDTGKDARQLCADLGRSFGDDHVFMDRREGAIPWGADWEKVLRGALDGCDALIALIGQRWTTCQRSSGGRRLDAADDWVRNEIATALRRAIPMFPVLLDGAAEPRGDELPDELRALGFTKAQAHPIGDAGWARDVEALVARLAEHPRLKALHQLATAKTGLERLKELIRTKPAVAKAVGGSRAIIETASQEISELGRLKDIHDALHDIEVECLEALRPGRDVVSQDRRAFNGAARAIRDAALRHLPPGRRQDPLLDDLLERLRAIAELFDSALGPGGSRVRARLVRDLEALISYFPDQLNRWISTVAKTRDLEQLIELMATVHDELGGAPGGAGAEPPAPDPELAPLLASIGSLGELKGRLDRLVYEHGLLQTLDNNVRNVCVGMSPADLDAEGDALGIAAAWHGIETCRAKLTPPLSHQLEECIGDLEPDESNLRAAVTRNDRAAAIGLFDSYHHAVVTVFRSLDKGLKEYCAELDKISDGLRNLLGQLEDVK